MKTLPRLALLSFGLTAASSLAQPVQPPRPPLMRPPQLPVGATPPGTAPGTRTITPTLPTAGAQPAAPAANKDKDGVAQVTQVTGPQKPTCEEVRKKARFNIYFDKVDIEKLVQTVSDATCRTFILPENVRGKISIIGPEAGKVEVDAEQFYGAFLAALDANGLNVSPYGKFLKVVEKRQAKQGTDITVIDPDEPITTNEQMVTKLFRIKYV